MKQDGPTVDQIKAEVAEARRRLRDVIARRVVVTASEKLTLILSIAAMDQTIAAHEQCST